jgi:hypothetical protein
MASMTTRTTSALTTAAVTALALAACGGGEGSGAAAKSPQEKFQEAALKHAECMRRHGVDVPDPKPGRGLVMDSRDVNPEEFDRAVRACDKQVGKPPVPQLSEKEQREFRDAALKHARCMRAQGIDFPDPTFGANGEVRIELGKGGAPPPDDPAFQAAESKCRKYLGKGAVTREGPGG